MIRVPAPLKSGSVIAVSAPSSGVTPDRHARLDLVLAHLREQGYQILEGEHVREQYKNTSAPASARAAELMRFFLDERVDAVFPPWGGERAIELLPLLEFEALREARPKWFLGFSDISTLQLPLTLRAGWVTAHGSNLIDMVPAQTDPLLIAAMGILSAEPGAVVVQRASEHFQNQWQDFASFPAAPWKSSEPTQWKRLDGRLDPLELRGRLIGGCMDTISRLAGTIHGDVPGFVRSCGSKGALLYLENCEMNPCELLRCLWSLRFHGWFEGLAGLLIGRNSGPEAANPEALAPTEALQEALGELPFPVLFDLDIGHRQPQLTLLNGLPALVRFEPGGGSLTTFLPGKA
jgi:muramoyltetrapeptide carboxypeptidase